MIMVSVDATEGTGLARQQAFGGPSFVRPRRRRGIAYGADSTEARWAASRGLRDFSRITRDDLIQLLNTGATTAFTDTPWNHQGIQVDDNTIEATELLVDARDAGRMGHWAAAIQDYETYLNHYCNSGDAAWREQIVRELDHCVAEERRETDERREAEESTAVVASSA